MSENLFNLIQSVPVIVNRYLPEKQWYNTRLKKWIKDKYLSRTKYKELVPFFVHYNGQIIIHPNNYEGFESRSLQEV